MKQFFKQVGWWGVWVALWGGYLVMSPNDSSLWYLNVFNGVLYAFTVLLTCCGRWLNGYTTAINEDLNARIARFLPNRNGDPSRRPMEEDLWND